MGEYIPCDCCCCEFGVGIGECGMVVEDDGGGGSGGGGKEAASGGGGRGEFRLFRDCCC